MQDVQSDDAVVLCDLFLKFEKLRKQNRELTVEEFASLHPEHADAIVARFGVTDFIGHIARPDIPHQIEQFELLEEIGRGGMGVVYRARQPRLQRDVALKMIPPDLANAENYARRFEQEALSASRLDHPNIISVFDYGVQDGTHWLAMPLIRGKSLDQLHSKWMHKQNDIASFRRIAAIGADIASALSYAHQHNTIHRDIKPSNLLMDSDGKVWVTDFGLARIEESDLSKSGDAIGTPRYMAPEQIRGFADERSDVYSLGITLWELCTGHRAWQTMSTDRVLNEKKNGVSLPGVQSLNANVPDDLARIIMTACAYHPDVRYQNAREMQHSLNQFAHGQDVTDRRRLRREPGKRETTRKWMLTTLFLFTIGITAATKFETPDSSSLKETEANDKVAIQRSGNSNGAQEKTKTEFGLTTDRVTAMSKKDSVRVRLRFESPGPRDGFFVQLAGGRDAFRLASIPYDGDKSERSFFLEPGIAPFDGNDDITFEIQLRVSSHTYMHASYLVQPTESKSRQLIVGRAAKDLTANIYPTSIPQQDAIVDFASSNGRDFLVLVNQGNRTLLKKYTRKPDTFEVSANQANSDFDSKVCAIATADGQTIFVANQSNAEFYVTAFKADASGRLSEVCTYPSVQISHPVEAMATIDGRLFSITARGDAESIVHKFCLFDDSTVRLADGDAKSDSILANSHWLVQGAESKSRIQPLAIHLAQTSGPVHFQSSESGRFLFRNKKRNVVTKRTVSAWQIIRLRTTQDKTDIAHIRHVATGNYLDCDHGYQEVDASTNANGEDKLWELIPSSDNTWLIRSVETGTYMSALEEAAGFDVKVSPTISPGCRWNIVTPDGDANSPTKRLQM